MVEAIFGVEEWARFRAVFRAAFRKHADVAASAEAAALAMVDDHRLDGVVIAPREQRIDHRFAHREVERVDRLGAIERNAADANVGRGDDVFGHPKSPTRRASAALGPASAQPGNRGTRLCGGAITLAEMPARTSVGWGKSV